MTTCRISTSESPQDGVRRAPIGALVCAAALLAASGAMAQGPPPAQVDYTEALERELSRTVRLNGLVEAPDVSFVAAEVPGLLVELEVREGERVERGAVLAKLRPRQIELALEAAKARLDEARSREKLAKRQLERSRELFAFEVISNDELDDSETELDAWRARAAQESAAIAQLEDRLSQTVIRAPFRGVVARELADLGEWVAVGDPLFELVSLDDLRVDVPVPEQHFATIAPGAAAEVRFEALPGEVLTGRIAAIIPRAGEQARSFPVKVAIPNPGGRIAVGMLAEVLLPTRGARQGTIVPKDAVVSSGRESTLFVVGEGDVVRRVPVTLGQGVSGWIEVDGNVQPGDKVVMRGNERLFPGQQVVPRRAELAAP